jgi:hypothetical protein
MILEAEKPGWPYAELWYRNGNKKLIQIPKEVQLINVPMFTPAELNQLGSYVKQRYIIFSLVALDPDGMYVYLDTQEITENPE